MLGDLRNQIHIAFFGFAKISDGGKNKQHKPKDACAASIREIAPICILFILVPDIFTKAGTWSGLHNLLRAAKPMSPAPGRYSSRTNYNIDLSITRRLPQ